MTGRSSCRPDRPSRRRRQGHPSEICSYRRPLCRLFTLGFFQMTAELEAHRREQFVLIIGFTTGGEALEKRGGEDGHRDTLVNGGLDGPPALTGIRHAPGELGESRILNERGGGEIQQ